MPKIHEPLCGLPSATWLPWDGITGTSAEPIWALVCGRNPERSRRGKLFMLTAFLDESYDARVYVVAGFMTTVEKWAQFSVAWELELKTNPKIRYFKMNHVFKPPSSGEFRNCTREQRIDKTEALIRVINSHLGAADDFAGSVVMDHRAYKEVLEPILPGVSQNPYLWCLQGILTLLSSYEKRVGKRGRVDFIFDENKQPFASALKLYERLADLPGFREFKAHVGRIIPGDDRTVLPLQAADLLAGQTRIFATSASEAIFMPSLQRTARPTYSYLLGEDKLMNLRRQILSTKAWLSELEHTGIGSE